jgi:hypothetical protein
MDKLKASPFCKRMVIKCGKQGETEIICEFHAETPLASGYGE